MQSAANPDRHFEFVWKGTMETSEQSAKTLVCLCDVLCIRSGLLHLKMCHVELCDKECKEHFQVFNLIIENIFLIVCLPLWQLNWLPVAAWGWRENHSFFAQLPCDKMLFSCSHLPHHWPILHLSDSLVCFGPGVDSKKLLMAASTQKIREESHLPVI